MILVGGPSSVGKTTASASLVRQHGLPTTHLDDYASKSSDPRIRFFDVNNRFWERSVDELVRRLTERSQALMPVLDELIVAARDRDATSVIEGEGIEPVLCEPWSNVLKMHVVCVVETSRSDLHQTLTNRSPDFVNLSPKHQATVVEMNCRYSEWLQVEAEQVGSVIVHSQPWETLPQRIFDGARLNWD